MFNALGIHNRISARSALECVSLATALDLGEPIESRTVLWRLKPPQLPLERKVTFLAMPSSPKSKAVASDTHSKALRAETLL